MVATNKVLNKIFNSAAAPDKIAGERRWVCWGAGSNPKMPLDPISGGAASSNDPSTWGTLSDAIRYAADHDLGIGCMLGDGVCGLDLDHVTLPSGELTDEAKKIMASLDGCGYAEVSPSGTGLHVIFNSEKPDGYTSRKELGEGSMAEFFCEGRYFTFTGDYIEGFDFDADSDSAVKNLAEGWFKKSINRGIDFTKLERSAPSAASTSCENYVKKIIEGDIIREGRRNSEMFSISGNIAKKVDYNEDETLDHCRRVNAARFDPPLDEVELRNVVRSSIDNGTRRVDTAPPVEPFDLSFEPTGEVDRDGAHLMQATFIEPDPSPHPNDIGESKADYHSIAEVTADTMLNESYWRDGGALEELVMHHSKKYRKQQMEYYVAGSLALLSKMFGDRLRGDNEYETAPLVNICVVGGSGSGKDSALKILKKGCEVMADDPRKSGTDSMAESRARETPSEMPEENVTSRPALCIVLEQCRSLSLIIDELGDYLTVSNSKNGSIHDKGLQKFFKELTANANSKGYKAHTTREGSIVLDYPSVNILGATTPDQLCEGISNSLIEGGLVGRFLFFNGLRDTRNHRIGVYERTKGEWSERMCNWIRDVYKTNSQSRREPPETLKIDQDAIHLAEKSLNKWDNIGESSDSGLIAEVLWGRAPDKVITLSMLYAASRAYREGRTFPDFVNVDDMKRAISLVEFLVARQIQWITLNSDPRLKKMSKVFAWVKEKTSELGGPVEIVKMTQALQRQGTAAELRVILDELQQNGFLSLTSKRNGKPTHVGVKCQD